MKRFLSLLFCLLAGTQFSHAVNVTTIEQLDSLALFSFSAFGDNNGRAGSLYNNTGDTKALGMARLEPWVENNDRFCLGVGDHGQGTRKTWFQLTENHPFWHNHYYPVLGDNGNETDYVHGSTADQAIWGRGWVQFQALNNFFNRNTSIDQIEFRQPGSAPVYSSQSKASPNTLVPYDDVLCDYYATRTEGAFTFHIIGLNIPDPGVLAPVSKNFMVNKLNNIAAVKTDYDIVIVNAQKAKWVKRAQDAGQMSRSERDLLMTTADLVLCGDDHVYRRQNEFDGDYNGTEAIWMNIGQPCYNTGSGRGYLNFHMFDNPPRFSVQYVLTEDNSTRKLHVNTIQRGSTQQSLPAECMKPYLKYINGPFVSIDWSNFPHDGSTPPPPPPPPPPDNPVVGFVLPSGNTTLNEGDSLQVEVSATDNNGVSRVYLYKDGVEFARSEGAAPYEWNAPGQNDPELVNLAAGTFTLRARAVDTVGDEGEATITITVLAEGEQPPPSNNILVNGSFESGTSPWTLGGSSSIVAGNAQSGSSSLQVVNNSSPTRQTVTLQQNTDYNFSAWVLTSGMTAGSVVIDTNDVFDSVGQTPGGTAQFVVGASGASTWTQFTGSFNSGSETSVQIRIFGNGTMTGTAYVDNIELSPVGGNNPPIITSNEVTTAQVGSAYSYTLTATDPDGDTLNLSGVAVPSWLTFDGGSGLLSGTPAAGNVGDHLVTLRASDAEADTDQTFTITVAPAPNDPPAWTNGNVTLSNTTEGVAYNFSVSSNASDPDGDALTFSILSSTANWLSISNDGTLSGTPGASDVGFGVLTISVSDGINAAVNAIYSITVEAAPADPYTNWKAANGVTDDAADDDGDGLENLVEFALDLDPNSEDGSGNEKPAVTENGAGLDISFKRGQSTVTYTIQRSTDLVTWTDYMTVNDSHGTVGNTATVFVPESQMSNGKCFLRLKVEN